MPHILEGYLLTSLMCVITLLKRFSTLKGLYIATMILKHLMKNVTLRSLLLTAPKFSDFVFSGY